MSIQKLEQIMPLIAKVVDGQNLTPEESESVFTNIFLNDKFGYHFVALLAGIHAKGETSDELLGLCRTNAELGERLNIDVVSADKITDLSGTGGGKIKTLNVSTAASFVVAASGYKVAKNAFYGVTSPTGSADIFKTFGVDIATLTKKQIEENINKVGISPVYLPYFSPNLKNRGILSKKALVSKGLRIRTPFHLASNAYNPFPIKFKTYGCYSDKYLETLAGLFSKLGLEKTLTFNGIDGLPEISNIGETKVVEQNKDKFKTYILKPEDLGVKRVAINNIASGGKESNIVDFLRVLMGKEKGAKSDLVAINASASLYVLGGFKSISEAVPKAKQILRNGDAFKVLEQLVKLSGDKNELQKWITKI